MFIHCFIYSLAILGTFQGGSSEKPARDFWLFCAPDKIPVPLAKGNHIVVFFVAYYLESGLGLSY